jgi:Tfp pilus assembly protein PilX
MNWLPAVHSRERGAALIIVLAFVVLLTGVAIAYLSRATSDRQVAHSSFNQSNVDQLAQSAMDNIIGDLRQEIVNGSTATIVNGITIYTPTATANTTAAANMIPQRSGNAAGVPNLIRRSVRSDPVLSPPGLGSRASAVNSTNPADVSANGRTVTSKRWNSHYLVPKGDPTTADSSPVPAFTAATPDWVFVTNSGATVIAAPNSSVIGRYAYALYDEGGLLDMNVAGYPSGTTAVQPGRKGPIAFADLTALPTTPLITQAQINSIVGWRNCASAQPSGIFPAFTFNPTQATNYVNSVLSNTDGFMRVRATRSDGTDNVWVSGSGGSNAAKRTDQMFPDRRSLIDLRTASGFNVNALQYLGTFSRETNSPSFSPATPTAINPNFLLARVTTSFTRFDGTTANIGDPLLNTRFPLSRLAWITYEGPSAVVYAANNSDLAITQLTAAGVPLSTIKAGTAANIKACFGLVWDSRAYVPVPGTGSPIGQQWVYVSPIYSTTSTPPGGNFDPNTNPSGNPASDIKSLNTVASENREPDFFELLRATISDGSLGQNTGGGVTGGATIFPDVHMSNKARHILSIGAAIMDQADPDSIPTRIEFEPAAIWWTAYGVESLPYITQIYPISGISPANPLKWATYLLFQLWNPHIGPALSPAAPQVRLRVDGGVAVYTTGNGQIYPAGNPQPSLATGQQISLTAGAFAPFSIPAPLGIANAASAPPVGTATAPCGFEVLPPKSSGTGINNYIGLRLLPDYTLTPAIPGMQFPRVSLYFGTDSTHRFNATMEYNAPGTATWVPYNQFIGINDSTSWINGAAVPVHSSDNLTGTPDNTGTKPDQFNTARLVESPPYSFMKADPRSTRFGIFQIDPPNGTTTRITDSLWPSNSATWPQGYGGTIADPGGPVEHAPRRFSTSGGGNQIYFPATLCINNSASTSTRTSYADGDGIFRPADAAYPDPSVATTGSSTPYFTTSTDYHPIILNRPFRNVAELGYAFRDLPWKTLDFFTDKSADAGLLDIFMINDGPVVLDTSGISPPRIASVPTIVAGSVNLNASQAADIQSVLAGAIWDELDSTNIVSKTGATATDAPVIASNIVTASSNTPLLNRSELLTRSSLPLTILPLPAGGTHNQTVKTRREVVERAISSVSQTRTWNLMIDVIAQSGRYPSTVTANPSPADLPKFVVDGEQRYWVHVAIDRFTGQVIDKQIEVVNE